MNKSAVQSLWISQHMPHLQRLCLESFLGNNTEFYIYVYKEVQGLPDGVKIMDTNSIIPEEFVFRDRYNSYATFADRFRINLLYINGRWSATVDEYVFAIELSNDHPVLCDCVMRTPKRAPMLKAVLDSVEQNLITKNYKNISWQKVGAMRWWTE